MHKQVHIHTWKQRCESARALAVSRHLLAACLCLSANRTSSEDIYHPAASSERQMTSQHLHSHLLTLFLLPPDHSCSPLHLLSTHLFLLLHFTTRRSHPSLLSLSLSFFSSIAIHFWYNATTSTISWLDSYLFWYSFSSSVLQCSRKIQEADLAGRIFHFLLYFRNKYISACGCVGVNVPFVRRSPIVSSLTCFFLFQFILSLNIYFFILLILLQ